MIYAFPVKYMDELKWIHVIVLFAVVKSSLISSQTTQHAASNCF